jgi:hypothetical protein
MTEASGEALDRCPIGTPALSLERKTPTSQVRDIQRLALNGFRRFARRAYSKSVSSLAGR